MTGRERNRDLTQKQGQQRRRASSFSKCITRSLVWFLVLTIIVYLTILSLLLNSKTSEITTTITELRGDSHIGDVNNIVTGKAKNINNKNKKNEKDDDGDTITIGVASTVTACGSDPFVDGAAVLKYSIDMNSAKYNDNSKYIYEHIIFYHPDAKECVLRLQNLGYILLEKPTPIDVDEIQGDGGLRERIVVTGCCGEKELIKLESFRLTKYPLVIHLDLDVIINKPMDDVLDFMLNPQRFKTSPELLAKIPIMWPKKEIPEDIQLLFTTDYNVVAPRRSDKPYQGGFFVIKPNIDSYDEFVNIVRTGDYDVKKGWGGKVGPFHGGMTVQGLFPWFYQYLHPGKSVELNRCIYNNMSDKPYLERNNKMRVCRTNEKECEDCRYKNMTDVVSFHFTICQKPWKCLEYKHQFDAFRLCREMNRLWYTYRSELETSWGRSGQGKGSLKSEHYRGYCNETGSKGYQHIQAPYGKPN